MKTFVGWLLVAVVLGIIFNISYPRMIQTSTNNGWELMTTAECKESLNLPDSDNSQLSQSEIQDLVECINHSKSNKLKQ